MLLHLYRVKSAHGVAHSALDTRLGIDYMRFLPLACDRVDRTIPEAEGTAGTFFRIDAVGDELLALARGAAFFLDVGLVFFPEVLDGCEDRVWRRLTEGTE